MTDRDRQSLLDILNSAVLVADYLHGIAQDDFVTDVVDFVTDIDKLVL